MSSVNSINKFQKVSVGSSGRITDYTSKISPSGDLQKVIDLNAILLSWNNILTTPLRSYTFDPNFGSDLYKLIFEPADNITQQKIEEEVRYRLAMNDDRARITSINISFFTNRKGFNVNILVEYMNVHGQLSSPIDQSMFSNVLGN